MTEGTADVAPPTEVALAWFKERREQLAHQASASTKKAPNAGSKAKGNTTHANAGAHHAALGTEATGNGSKAKGHTTDHPKRRRREGEDRAEPQPQRSFFSLFA